MDDKQLELEPGEAVKFDYSKPRWDLLPFDALEEIVKVLSHGAIKYGDRNWESGFRWGRIYGSLMRHLCAWFRGEDNDLETGLSHLSHAGCNVLFLITFALRKLGSDDRSKNINYEKVN